jgi:glycosyltransferase family protein
VNLSTRLREILNKDYSGSKMFICIPGIWGDLKNFTDRSFWFSIHHVFKHNESWNKLLNKHNIYGDSFITRPFISYKNKNHSENIFNKIKSLWNNKNVTLIEGAGSRMGVGNDLFQNTKSLKRILCPSENAFDKFEEIKKEALKIDKNDLILLSLGPTAKVLAYDLFLLGYRVIDIGHLDMEYEMFLRNSATIIKVHYKYFNEINERNPEECNDRIYLEQIIAKIQ